VASLPFPGRSTAWDLYPALRRPPCSESQTQLPAQAPWMRTMSAIGPPVHLAQVLFHGHGGIAWRLARPQADGQALDSQVQVAGVEEGHRVAFAPGVVDHPVAVGVVAVVRPAADQVAQI